VSAFNKNLNFEQLINRLEFREGLVAIMASNMMLMMQFEQRLAVFESTKGFFYSNSKGFSQSLLAETVAEFARGRQLRFRWVHWRLAGVGGPARPRRLGLAARPADRLVRRPNLTLNRLPLSPPTKS